MKATIIFDFDYTLFDAARFKEAMAASLVSCGVASEAFWESYAQVTAAADKICDYDPGRHVESLAGSLTCAPAEALRRILSVVERAAEFLLPGAASVLQRLKRDGATLVLFTHGNVSWQERKADRSGLLPYFSKTIFSAENKEKSEALAGFEVPVVMVNDNGREIDALQKAYPAFRTIAVRGPKSLPTDPAVPVCDNLEAVYKAIVGGLQ